MLNKRKKTLCIALLAGLLIGLFWLEWNRSQHTRQIEAQNQQDQRTKSVAESSQTKTEIIGATMPAMAQNQKLLTQDDIIKRAREDFQKAKTKEAVESITMWCTDTLDSLNFHERDRLMAQSIKLLEAKKGDEAAALIKRGKAIEELNKNLASLVCRPD